MQYRFRLAVLAVVILPFSSTRVFADSAALRAAQSANTDLLYQWSFEGDATQRLLDTAGGADVRNLRELASENGGDTANIAYVPGFDSSTTALAPEHITETVGAGLQSMEDGPLPEDDLFLPQKMTVEVLFQVDSKTLSCDGSAECVAYGPNTRQWPQRRGYYLVQDNRPNSPANGDIAVLIGDNFVNNPRTVIDNADLVAGDWYYYAVTLEATEPEIDIVPDDEFPQDSDGSDTIINAYYANVSAGETTLTKAIDNLLPVDEGGWSGPKNSVGFGRIGIGTFSEQPKQNWQGLLDEVAFYSEVLNQSELQSNLDALLAAAGQAGDFDDDSDVDGNDFLKWQRGESDNALSPDDLSDWNANYGVSGALVTAVPEPSTAILVQASVLLLCIRRRTA